ncbi:MAG TPA: alpha/beta fold hydrolase [Fimbriimonadaceae bacterium]|nr:alpha/beta fold hydrolase [Fimbriimonadaceae bacterium]HRJ97754.1 alpha/beta fold hydrolase [Fimbriimonadaceae bacterium]
MASREVEIVADERRTVGVLDTPDGSPLALIVLGHGAGGNAQSPRLRAIAEALVERGMAVFRFDFFYRRAGKSIPDRMPLLLECFRAATDAARSQVTEPPLVLGGHSMGGRVASMLVAEERLCDGLLLLSYPLHPPGKPDQLRDEHLPRIEVPTLLFSGTNDPFCTPALMEGVLARVGDNFRMNWIEQADHSLHVPRSAGTDAEVRAQLADRVASWVKTLGVAR